MLVMSWIWSSLDLSTGDHCAVPSACGLTRVVQMNTCIHIQILLKAYAEPPLDDTAPGMVLPTLPDGLVAILSHWLPVHQHLSSALHQCRKKLYSGGSSPHAHNCQAACGLHPCSAKLHAGHRGCSSMCLCTPVVPPPASHCSLRMGTTYTGRSTMYISPAAPSDCGPAGEAREAT